MTSYAAYDGVPLIANYHILTEILREEWGYKYWTTSDAGATDRLCYGFKMCQANPTDQEAVTLYVGCVSALLASDQRLTRVGPSCRK
jgi:beta-glucosidase